MTTKEKLIELMLLTLSGGDAPADLRGKYHPADITLHLSIAYQDIIQDFINKGGDVSTLDGFSKPVKCIVKYDADREQRYIDTGVTIIPLTPMQAGIRALSMYRGQQIAFAPVEGSSAPIWNELEAVRVDTVCGYNLEANNRIYFEIWNQPSVGNELMLKYIPPMEDLDDTDNVFVPGGNNKELFDRTYDLMRARGNSSDEYNDNNSTQTQ